MSRILLLVIALEAACDLTHREVCMAAPIDPQQEARVIALLEEAGDVLLNFWPGKAESVSGALQVSIKADGTQVSEADHASNQIVIDGLASLFPDDLVLSEELEVPAGAKDAARLWILDPLDGTKHFINGTDNFSILLGLCIDGTPQAGFMYYPARSTLVCANGGTRINGARVGVSDNRTFGTDSICVRGAVLGSRAEIIKDKVESGRALFELCRGGFDGVVLKIGKMATWDVAAPVAAVLQSGGRVTDERGEPFDLRRATLESGFLVASNGYLHDQLLKILADH
ncbi:MAG: inositol monophosphatase [Bdellovibrionales bacterium]|nr:inositol monophosphatase [Bdellovibrionales bacterium]